MRITSRKKWSITKGDTDLSPPPITDLDLSTTEKKCCKCKEPLPLHVTDIRNITADTFANILCHVFCKLCKAEHFPLLPCKSDPVKKLLRSLITPNSDAHLESLNCNDCKKPCNMDITNIIYIAGPNSFSPKRAQVLIPCNSDKCDGQIWIPHKCEPMQKFLRKLCN